MTVEEMERRFYELKGKLDVGTITQEQFKSEIEQLRFKDSQNRWWMIGAQSGKWYYFDGARWIPGQMPAEESARAEPPTAPSPAVPTTPPPAAQEQPRQATPSAAAALTPAMTASVERLRAKPGVAPTAGAALPEPEQAEHVPIARPPRRSRAAAQAPALPQLPISGPVLIISAAIIAFIAVLLFWIVLDNLVPSRPISSFLGGLTGGSQSAAVATPTALAGQAATPKEISILVTTGDQFVLQSQMDVAIAQYQNAAQLAPTNATPLIRWARALAFKGQVQDSVLKAQQAMQRAPNDAEAYAQVCRALAWNGQLNEAIVAGEKAIQLDPKNANAHAILAEAYLLARRSADAQPRAQAALQLMPQSAEAHRAQAWVLTLQGQKDAALAEWRQTITLEPNFYFRHFEFGEALRLYLGMPADAVAEHQKAVDLYGAYIPAISRLGMALLAANRPQEAMARLQRALTLDPNNADNYAYLGIAYGQVNQCLQAIPYFEQALKLDASNTAALRGLNDCKAGKAPTLPLLPPTTAPLAIPTLVPK